MEMKKVVAIHAIGVSDPEVNLETIGYTDAGDPIIRKRTITVAPGTLFDFPAGAELAQLIEMGAIRLPTAAELALGKADDVDHRDYPLAPWDTGSAR